MTSAVFDPSGARIVTASPDGTARLWDAPSGEEIAILRGHEGGVLSAAFDPSGARIVTASHDGTARLWNAASGEGIAILRGHRGWVANAAFDPSGDRIVTTSHDGTARLWDAASGEEVAAVDLDGETLSVAVHGNLIALGDALGRVHIFDLSEPGEA